MVISTDLLDRFCDEVTIKYPGGFSIQWNKTNSGITEEDACNAENLNGQINA